MKDKKVTSREVRRFQELDARWHGVEIRGKPLGLTADEPTEHLRLASKLAQEFLRTHPPVLVEPVKVGLDIGGVLSKYPEILRPIVDALLASPDVEVHVLTDMPDRVKATSFCHDNGFIVPAAQIHSCDYSTHGEECKAVKARKLGLHVLVDDFPGYVAVINAPALRLMTMPDPTRDYYHETWKTDGSEGDFGRRKVK